MRDTDYNQDQHKSQKNQNLFSGFFPGEPDAGIRYGWARLNKELAGIGALDHLASHGVIDWRSKLKIQSVELPSPC